MEVRKDFFFVANAVAEDRAFISFCAGLYISGTYCSGECKGEHFRPFDSLVVLCRCFAPRLAADVLSNGVD
jgi:hypothetical protein